MSKKHYYFGTDGCMRSISDDELRHWKYISKKRVNGKWVYTYDNPELHNATKKENIARAEIDVAKKKHTGAKYGVKDAAIDLNSYASKSDDSINAARRLQRKENNYKEVLAKEKQAAQNVEKAVKKHEQAAKNLKKTKLKMIPGKMLARGLTFVSNLFSRN